MKLSRPAVKSRDEVRSEFRRAGRSVVGWARENGFNPSLVYATLNGSLRCRRGESHHVAVLLGLKVGHVEPRGHPLNAHQARNGSANQKIDTILRDPLLVHLELKRRGSDFSKLARIVSDKEHPINPYMVRAVIYGFSRRHRQLIFGEIRKILLAGPAPLDERRGARQEIRFRFKRGVVSLRQWARDHGCSAGLVSGVLSGKLPANRGKSREVAILLGLTSGEIQL